MAKAPKIGSTPSARENDDAKTLIIRRGTEEYTLNFEDLGPKDDADCRRATGMPVSAFFSGGADGFGSDSLLVMYWIARRRSGDLSLTYDQVLETFPTHKSIKEADFEIRGIVENEDEDPLP